MTNLEAQKQTIGALATGEQQKASNPSDCVWVEASAGTGKTKILSDRVLRLLLKGVNPSKILALTYTKAAAVEMNERIYKRLSDWVGLSDEKLIGELKVLLGGEIKEEQLIRARRLFASILDAPINMRIQTIHAFCQEILKRFAFEAKVSPYFDVVDELSAKEIAQKIKVEILGDEELFEAIAFLSENTSEDGFSKILNQIINNRGKIAENNFIKKLDVDFNPVLGVDFGDEKYESFKLKYLTKDGDVRKKLGDEDTKTALQILEYEQKITTLLLYKATDAVLQIAQKFVAKYDEYKRQNSLMDYDDLIFFTHKLLQTPGVSDWVLYKLDGGIDHVLIDEAQDTSFEQWNIILALTEEFFASENNKTVFVVGDRKQSIYSFQGADVQKFEAIKKYLFAQKTDFREINLSVSFRSVAPILENVNNVFKAQNINHIPYRIGEAGEVYVWDVIEGDKVEKEEWSVPSQRISKESSSLKLAKKIATKIQHLVGSKQILQSKNRAIKYQDFLILVQRRNGFVDELVRELKAQNVNVLGVDRLMLLEQIAVLDLLALAKFLLLPSDDLNLACVLKSPFFGFDDNDLFELCYKRKNTLFNALRDNKQHDDTYKILQQLLNMADFVRPFELFSYLLINLEGRKKIISRLGYEALDAVDEFMNLAINFERDNVVSLQGFVDWIERDDIEIKRQLETGVDAVRIMTVHGSKGLQAPIVIMPDTLRVPSVKNEGQMLFDEGILYPLNSSYYDDTAKEIVDKLNQNVLAEYNRLLYVALTRAEDILIVCGYNNSKKIDERSWYTTIKNSLSEIGTSDADGLVFKNQQTINVEPKKEEPPQKFELGSFDFIYKKAPIVEALEKPFAPSKMGDDEEEYELNVDNYRFAKGLLIHKILQFMPDLSFEKIDDSIKAEVSKMFENQTIKDLFAQNSRAEVAVCGRVGDKIINGVIDRLVVRQKDVLIVDYKTDRKTDVVPEKYKNQLRAYKSLVQQIYPDKELKTYILWTANQELVEV